MEELRANTMAKGLWDADDGACVFWVLVSSSNSGPSTERVVVDDFDDLETNDRLEVGPPETCKLTTGPSVRGASTSQSPPVPQPTQQFADIYSRLTVGSERRSAKSALSNSDRDSSSPARQTAISPESEVMGHGKPGYEPYVDYKSKLNLWLQQELRPDGNAVSATCVYTDVNLGAPFKSSVCVHGRNYTSQQPHTRKKDSQQEAAYQALAALGAV